jgi:hypothetical protein
MREQGRFVDVRSSVNRIKTCQPKCDTYLLTRIAQVHITVENRDFQAGFRGECLHLIDENTPIGGSPTNFAVNFPARINTVQYRPDLVGIDPLLELGIIDLLCLGVVEYSDVNLGHLTDFLIEGHRLQQRVHIDGVNMGQQLADTYEHYQKASKDGSWGRSLHRHGFKHQLIKGLEHEKSEVQAHTTQQTHTPLQLIFLAL